MQGDARARQSQVRVHTAVPLCGRRRLFRPRWASLWWGHAARFVLIFDVYPSAGVNSVSDSIWARACSLFYTASVPSQTELVRLRHWGLVSNEVCQVPPGIRPRSSSAMLSPALLTSSLRDILSLPLIDRPARLHIHAQSPLFRYRREIIIPTFHNNLFNDGMGGRIMSVKEETWSNIIGVREEFGENKAQSYFGGKSTTDPHKCLSLKVMNEQWNRPLSLSYWVSWQGRLLFIACCGFDSVWLCQTSLLNQKNICAIWNSSVLCSFFFKRKRKKNKTEEETLDPTELTERVPMKIA